MPVLPLVGSISVSPGLMRPLFSASATIDQPMRSLSEPPGFRNSHFAHSVAGQVRADAVEPDQRGAADDVEDRVEAHAAIVGDGAASASAAHDRPPTGK